MQSKSSPHLLKQMPIYDGRTKVRLPLEAFWFQEGNQVAHTLAKKFQSVYYRATKQRVPIVSITLPT